MSTPMKANRKLSRFGVFLIFLLSACFPFYLFSTGEGNERIKKSKVLHWSQLKWKISQYWFMAIFALLLLFSICVHEDCVCISELFFSEIRTLQEILLFISLLPFQRKDFYFQTALKWEEVENTYISPNQKHNLHALELIHTTNFSLRPPHWHCVLALLYDPCNDKSTWSRR